MSIGLVFAPRLSDSHEMDDIIHSRFARTFFSVDYDLNAVLGTCTLKKLFRRGFTGTVQILGKEYASSRYV